MPNFGRTSKKRLETCHPKLQKVMKEVIKHVDCTILCGHRGEKEQNEAVATGHSNVVWQNGRHNKYPSNAVDVAPWPLDWQDYERFTLFAGFVLGIAKSMDIELIWGNDWDGDFETKDTNLKDYPHFELKNE